jgi:hypothetical protein
VHRQLGARTIIVSDSSGGEQGRGGVANSGEEGDGARVQARARGGRRQAGGRPSKATWRGSAVSRRRKKTRKEGVVALTLEERRGRRGTDAGGEDLSLTVVVASHRRLAVSTHEEISREKHRVREGRAASRQRRGGGVAGSRQSGGGSVVVRGAWPPRRARERDSGSERRRLRAGGGVRLGFGLGVYI